MPGYGQFCPIAQAAEVLTERWTPLVIRELALTGSRRFNDIQRGVPLMSSSLLSKRLRELERALAETPYLRGDTRYRVAYVVGANHRQSRCSSGGPHRDPFPLPWCARE